VIHLNLQISLPLRLICEQDGQELKLEGQGPQPGIAVVKCPACGVRIRLIQGPAPAQPQTLDARAPRYRPTPKT